MGWILVKIPLSLLATSLASVAALAQTVSPPSSAQDSRTTYREMLCGSQCMPPISTEIPTIGCFGGRS
jgi:hypothetical protein